MREAHTYLRNLSVVEVLCAKQWRLETKIETPRNQQQWRLVFA